MWILPALLACSGDEPEAGQDVPDEVMERALAAREEGGERKAPKTTRKKRRQDRWARLASAVRALGSGEVAEQVEALLDEREARREADELRLERSLAAVERGLVLSCEGESVDRAFLDYQSDQAAVLQQDRRDLERILDLSGDQGRELIWSIAHPERTFAAGRREAVQADLPQLGQDQSAGMIRLRLDLEVAMLDASEQLEAFEARVLELDPSKPRSAQRSVEALRELDQALLANQGQRYLRLQESCGELDPELWLELVDEGHVAATLQTFPAPIEVKTSSGAPELSGESPSLARMKREPKGEPSTDRRSPAP